VKTNNQPCNFFLLTENSFHPVYLVSQWYTKFQNNPFFKGILIRDDRNEALQLSKEQFHHLHRNKKLLTSEFLDELQTLYGGVNKAEEAMIKLFGIPELAPNSFQKSNFLGKNINSEKVKRWLEIESKSEGGICIFVFLDKILSPWWIELTKGNIINAHSAVLPYARGMFAIENIASRGDSKEFQRVAGASVHYVDEGVDTGPIIRAVRIKNPLEFQSLGEVKAYSYKLAFDLLIQQASEMSENFQIEPVGIKPDLISIGSVFSRKDYTSQVEKLAEKKFTEMKQDSVKHYKNKNSL
jgi:phosphoribosylglycinamide formyltransferase-1